MKKLEGCFAQRNKSTPLLFYHIFLNTFLQLEKVEASVQRCKTKMLPCTAKKNNNHFLITQSTVHQLHEDSSFCALEKNGKERKVSLFLNVFPQFAQGMSMLLCLF